MRTTTIEAPQQKSTLNRKPIALVGIAGIAILIAFPWVRSAIAGYQRANALRGLHDLAIQYARAQPDCAETLGGPVKSWWYTVTCVNLPTDQDDARIRFCLAAPKTDAIVLARGRYDNGNWQLTYVEVQATFGSWFVFGELGGFDRTARLEPLDWPTP